MCEQSKSGLTFWAILYKKLRNQPVKLKRIYKACITGNSGDWGPKLYSSFGDRTFAAAGPLVSNSLPPNLRLCELSYGQFRRLLKTFYSDSEAAMQRELF